MATLGHDGFFCTGNTIFDSLAVSKVVASLAVFGRRGLGVRWNHEALRSAKSNSMARPSSQGRKAISSRSCARLLATAEGWIGDVKV